MEMDFDRALEVFAALDPAQKAPSQHPAYVRADAERSPELRPVFFVHDNNGSLYYHGFHLAAVDGTAFFDIQSPYGYGGPVASSNDEAFLAGARSAFGVWCREHNVLVEFIRFHPLLDNWGMYHGEVIPDRQTVWIDLRTDDLLMSYGTRARTAIRKAVREGLRVEWVDALQFLRLFPTMYRRAMAALNADEFYHFGDRYFEQMLRWDNLHTALCFLGSEVVGGAMFLAEGIRMEYHLSAVTPTGKKLSATNLMLHEAGLLGQKLECTALHLGGGTDSRENNALLFFKAGFSPHREVFKIGKHVHQPAAYNGLREKWRQIHGSVSERILFYRI